MKGDQERKAQLMATPGGFKAPVVGDGFVKIAKHTPACFRASEGVWEGLLGPMQLTKRAFFGPDLTRNSISEADPTLRGGGLFSRAAHSIGSLDLAAGAAF